MKIFNIENGKPVVYVQQKNIKALIRLEDDLPRKLYKLAKKLNLSNANKTHDEDFIRITDKKTINQIMSTDWIIDYRNIRDISEETIQNCIDELTVEVHDMRICYNSLTFQEQRKKEFITEQNTKKIQKINDLKAYLLTKQGKYPELVKIPLVIDSKANIISSNGVLKFGRSLDKSKIIISRKDGSTFCGKHINPTELNMGLMVYMAEENLTPKENGELNFTINSEPTNKYLIAEYSFETEKNYEPTDTVEQNEPTRIKTSQKVKAIFPNKKDEN